MGSEPAMNRPEVKRQSAPGTSPQGSSFGPSALATPANAVTGLRLLATPVVIAMVALRGPGWTQFAVAFAVAATDGLDGWIARRQGATRSGAFLDPLADKAIVIGLLAVVAARGEVAWLPVALIAAREVAMSVYRYVMARRGISIPARLSAKVKTIVQDLAVGMCIIPEISGHHGILAAGLWVAVALTLYTGAEYMRDGGRAARRGRVQQAADPSTTPGTGPKP